ncbi:MAG: peptide chain release factor N(5)-glutamine methyltransferase [Candidatus Saccharibacteria bacterium]|nr:peptide chain release factor N(5)-glutamine methyltransferase [Candidatus Saccharibacteria bacterium]
MAKKTKALESAGISTARLDCLVLLEDATGKDRSWLLAHPEHELESSKVKKLKEQVQRRAKHEPLAYIRGRSAFYGREFLVNEHTLQPRPETETMIDHLKSLYKVEPCTEAKSSERKALSIVDVGTGSGCIGITAKLELPDAEVYATDISEECLKIARKNARKLKANVEFHKANLLLSQKNNSHFLNDRSKSENIVLLANLPYVPEGFTINQAAMFEPDVAIFGGKDGLDYYRELFAQIETLKTKPHFIFTESLPTQHKDLTAIAEKHGFRLHECQDFIQVFIRR